MKRFRLSVGSALLIAVLVFIGSVFFYAQDAQAVTKEEEVKNLQDQIDAKEKSLEELRDKIDTYKDTIRERQLESLSLESQISILETDIAKTQTEIDARKAQIDVLTLEIEKFKTEIEDKKADIDTKKAQLEYFVITSYKNDKVTPLEVALSQSQFSDFFRQVEYNLNLQGQYQATLDEIQEMKKGLERQQAAVETKAAELDKEKTALEDDKNELAVSQAYKVDLLDQTKESEEQFQKLVEDAQNEQNSANYSIVSLERQIREKLNKPADPNDDENVKIDLPGDLSLVWPVPSQYITCRFRDASYPFRRYFEHTAIDIRAGQGTPIKAAETGVVGIAKNAGMGYSYIMLVHGGGYSTVYGHVSAIYVNPGEYVQKGDIIGLSGGAPGTPGAGVFTTAAHLHFEVRLNGIPVNPELYLP